MVLNGGGSEWQAEPVGGSVCVCGGVGTHLNCYSNSLLQNRLLEKLGQTSNL